MTQQAIATLQQALIVRDRDPVLMGALAHAYARAGQREEALKLVGELKRLDVRLEAERRSVPRFPFTWAYAGLGDKEQAFAWLEKAYQERRARMYLLNVDPLLDPLRSDPRFQDLVRRAGLGSR
jgi:pentatricopeptide repeat protein